MRLSTTGIYCVAAASALLLASCKGKSSPRGGPDSLCDGACLQQALTQNDVEHVVAQASIEAQAQGLPVTIAVVDRVGNVLAVFRMTGASTTVEISAGRSSANGSGLAGFEIETTLAAISKAGTAAYLSSQGNAFSTRTASQIVQENFNPGERVRAGGPLFGVQFSQLPCGDFVRRFERNGLTEDVSLGPKRMPLGFSADPGGLPLYKSGVPVGGVGIELGTNASAPAEQSYRTDPDVLDQDVQREERIATAAAVSFAAPANRRANAISVDGRFLRFADDERVSTQPIPLATPVTLPPSLGVLVDVDGFFAGGGVLAGTELLTPASGIVASSVDGIAAELVVKTDGTNRYPAIDSLVPTPAAGGMSTAEVTAVLREALRVAGRSRAQIRRPAGSSVRVNISIVDTEGTVLGFARTPDAPIFGADVSLQKARTAAFLSRLVPTSAADDLIAALPPLPEVTAKFDTRPVSEYLIAAQTFLAKPDVLDDGTAISDRTLGNLARPFFPDGVNGNPPGPFSRVFERWSPFSTGLQLDAGLQGIAVALCRSSRELRSLLSMTAVGMSLIPPIDPDFPNTCPAEPIACTDALGLDPALRELANGLQIFPGSVPIYRGSQLVGAIGVSGDGVDQDDMVAFLGLHNAGQLLGTGIGNAPIAQRADQIQVGGVNLRYVSCPPSPFLDSSEQSPCKGL